MAEEFEQTSKCDLCATEYLVGRQGQEDIYLPYYQIHVCKLCFDCNSHGWAPLYEQKLSQILAVKSIPQPERNALGLLPREP